MLRLTIAPEPVLRATTYERGAAVIERPVIGRDPLSPGGVVHQLYGLLARAAGRTVTVEGLIGAIWRHLDSGNVENLRAHVAKLRRVLPAGERVVTVYGVGYRLERTP